MSKRAQKDGEKRAAKAATSIRPVCVECGSVATTIVPWSAVYKPRPERPDLMAKKFWKCECGTFVGCHAGTDVPLGYPCNGETARWRRKAHLAFDPIWRRKKEKATEPSEKRGAREAGYRWLADKLGMTREACHIGMMTLDQAKTVVDLCALYAGADGVRKLRAESRGARRA